MAKLRGDVFEMVVRWEDEDGVHLKVCWTISGTSHTLYLPEHVKECKIGFAGRASSSDQWWSRVIDEWPWGPNYPEIPGMRQNADKNDNTWLFVRRGTGKRAYYRKGRPTR